MRVPCLTSSRRLLAASVLVVGLLSGCGSLTMPVTGAVQSSAIAAPNPASIPPAVQQAIPVQQAETLAGKILFVRDGNLWIWQAGTSRQFSQGGTWSQPQYSPDGSEVAYVYWSNNFSDLFLMAADGTNNRRLTRSQSAVLADNSWAMRPTWSPDGTRLAYVSDANSNFNQVWVSGKDGNNRRQLTSEAMGILWADSISWDPNGARLAITAAPDNRAPSQIYLLDVVKGTYEKFSGQLNGAYDASFSPDGSMLAYMGRPGVQPTLTVQTVEGTTQVTFDKLPFMRSPVWSPDGKTVAFMSSQGGVFEIWTLTVTRSAGSITLTEPRQLTRDAAIDPMSGLSWTR